MSLFGKVIDVIDGIKQTEDCEGCINIHTCMCDNCKNRAYWKGPDNNHSDTGKKFDDYCYSEEKLAYYYGRFPGRKER